MEWQAEARRAIATAEFMHDDYVPTYRVPKPRKWWQFWKPQEWEIVRGLSRAQLRWAQEAMQRHYAQPRPDEEV